VSFCLSWCLLVTDFTQIFTNKCVQWTSCEITAHEFICKYLCEDSNWASINRLNCLMKIDLKSQREKVFSYDCATSFLAESICLNWNMGYINEWQKNKVAHEDGDSEEIRVWPWTAIAMSTGMSDRLQHMTLLHCKQNARMTNACVLSARHLGN
jgi:hypothetical protein